MALGPNPQDVLDTVHTRGGVLRALSPTESLSQIELSEQLPVSRPTVSRAVSAFESQGLVEQTNEGYQLTKFGASVLRRNREYVADISALCQRATVTDVADSVAFDDAVFDGAEVFFSDSNAPESASYDNAEIIDNANVVQSTLNSIFTIFLKEHLEQIRTRGQEVTLIVPTELAASMKNTYSDLLEELLHCDEFRLLEVDKRVPITVTYAETPLSEYAIVLVHNDDGQIVSSLRNDDPEAIKWAQSWFRNFESMATEIILEDS